MTDEGLTPSQWILARCRAFVEGDFGFIFDSYHPDSFFRQQFPDRSEYVAHGRMNLVRDFRIRECRILHEDVGSHEARLIYYLDTWFKGERLESFELSIFLRTEDGWRYYSTQKLDRRQFPGEIEEIGWEDFERIEDKIVF